MNGIRFVQKGDAPKEGITTRAGVGRHASCSTRPRTDRAGFGRGRPRRARRQHPARLLQRSGEDRGDVRHRREGSRAGRSPATSRCVEADGRITLLGRGSVSINSGGEKMYPEEVEGALEVASRRVRRARRRRARRAVGRAGRRVAAAARRAGRRRSRSCRSTAATRIAGYKVPRELLLVAEVPRLPNGKPDYRRAKEQAKARGRRLSRARAERAPEGVVDRVPPRRLPVGSRGRVRARRRPSIQAGDGDPP